MAKLFLAAEKRQGDAEKKMRKSSLALAAYDEVMERAMQEWREAHVGLASRVEAAAGEIDDATAEMEEYARQIAAKRDEPQQEEITKAAADLQKDRRAFEEEREAFAQTQAYQMQSLEAQHQQQQEQ